MQIIGNARKVPPQVPQPLPRQEEVVRLLVQETPRHRQPRLAPVQ